MNKVCEYRGFTIYLDRNGEYYTPAMSRLHTRKTLKAAKGDINRRIGVENRRIDKNGRV